MPHHCLAPGPGVIAVADAKDRVSGTLPRGWVLACVLGRAAGVLLHELLVAGVAHALGLQAGRQGQLLA